MDGCRSSMCKGPSWIRNRQTDWLTTASSAPQAAHAAQAAAAALSPEAALLLLLRLHGGE